MSNDTPNVDDIWEKFRAVTARSERESQMLKEIGEYIQTLQAELEEANMLAKAALPCNHYTDDIIRLERENARLREELAEAKRNGYKMFMECGEASQSVDFWKKETIDGNARCRAIEAELDQCVGRLQDTQAELKQAEARALAHEKDALRWNAGKAFGYPIKTTSSTMAAATIGWYMKSAAQIYSTADAAIDAAIGAKHEPI